MRDVNQLVKNGYAKFKYFPVCNSKEMLHYTESTLEIDFYESAIFRVGINDLLNNKSPSSTDMYFLDYLKNGDKILTIIS